MEALARRVAGERRVALLDLTREYRAYRHELLAACERVLERMQLLGGEEVRAFESEMAAYLGVRQVCGRSEEHTSELQSQSNLVCRLLLEKKNKERSSHATSMMRGSARRH